MDFESNFKEYSFPKLGYIKIPKIEIPADDIKKLNLRPNCSGQEYLRALMINGFESKLKSGLIPKNKADLYLQRIESEFDEIVKLLFTDYILLVYNIIKFCRNNSILNSPSRGSCGGSLLLWVIDVIKIDAIKHNLLFERFISAGRTEVKEIDGEKYISSKNVPDVDIDNDRSLKFKVNQFLESQFKGRTASIKTFSTLQGKSIIKEVLKCYEEFSEQEAKEISDLVQVNFGKVEQINDALSDNPKKENIKFKEWAKNYKDAVVIAQKLNGLIKGASVHASGIILCNDKLEDCLPLELSMSSEENAKVIVSAFDMEGAQNLGIKVDNLGLKNLEAIKECLGLVGKKLEDIDVNHPSIYNYLNNSNYYKGIFQAEDGLGKAVLQKIKPNNIEDISLSVAIGRPGSYKFIDDIIDGKFNNNIKKIDSRVNDILNNTFNVIVYQEQIMALSRRMANFSPQDADGLRKGIGKKIKEKVLEYKDKFIKQSIENKYDKTFVEEMWQTFEDSGDYLFNKSHSCGYSYLTAICAYLKANHPTEFFYTLLKNAKNESKPLEEITAIVEELPQFGIELLPPSLLLSDIDFKIEGKSKIRMGLGDIKGISRKALDKLKNFKTSYSNKLDLFQSSQECGLNVGVMSALIQAGAMDEFFYKSRSRMVLELQLYRILTPREKVKVMSLAKGFNYDLYEIVLFLTGKTNPNKEVPPFIKDKRLLTIRKKYDKYKQIFLQNSKNQELANYFYERKLLGFSYSQDIYNILQKEHPDIVKVSDIVSELPDSKRKYVFGGEIVEVIYGTARNAKKTKYVKLKIQDKSGAITSMMFNDKIETSEFYNKGKFEEGQIVVCVGKKINDDSVFCDEIARQEAKIMMNLSELKDLDNTES